MKSAVHSLFIGSQSDVTRAGTVLVGCPLDMTSSFRGGTRFAPESIRRASWTLETYSPYLQRDLDDILFYDAGDVELPLGDLAASLDIIENAVREITQKDMKVFALGGEHLVSLPIVKAVRERRHNLQVVHFDAHCDLRDDYEGQKLSHATVMKRVKELGAPLVQIGIRSGTRQEFRELNAVDSPAALASCLLPDMPMYVTFDLDVLDPSLAGGVTTPEPGGLQFKEVMEYFAVLKGRNIVGADVVELAPDYDPTFVSSVCAAKIVRELLMLLAPFTAGAPSAG